MRDLLTGTSATIPGRLARPRALPRPAVGAFSLTAKGFTASDVATNLFSKLGGTDENGLGLTNDPSGNDEISLSHGFVQLNLDGLLSKLHGFEFSLASTTQGEGWSVFGPEDDHPFNLTFLAQSIGLNDEAVHSPRRAGTITSSSTTADSPICLRARAAVT